ncbi:hypothetical protein BJ944DRAFT_238674 [Cunninghamella echinulata]|nr:hypothetical protein BJ944DRAFT_238674 [Cunninghamella echinulata]
MNNDTTSHHYYKCNTGNLTHLDTYQGFTRNTDHLIRSTASAHLYEKNSKMNHRIVNKNGFKF